MKRGGGVEGWSDGVLEGGVVEEGSDGGEWWRIAVPAVDLGRGGGVVADSFLFTYLSSILGGRRRSAEWWRAMV
jgi:hypothetical protein